MWGAAACLFTAVVAFALPVAALVFFACRRDRLTVPCLLGVLTFLVFQVLTRIPALQLLLPKTVWFSVLPIASPVLYALFLGFTAALFEEGGRWLVMRTLMRRRTRWMDGIAFGAGHGGLEAVLFGGLNALLLLVLYGGPAGANATGWEVLASGVERLSAMTLHVGWSLMVLRSVRKRNAWGLVLAVALHTALDAGVVLLQPHLSMFALEAVLFAAAALMLAYILHTKKSWEENES